MSYIGIFASILILIENFYQEKVLKNLYKQNIQDSGLGVQWAKRDT